MYDVLSEYKITPLFNYIREKSKEAGLYPYYANAKQVIELFINHELLEDRSIRIGSIQYEGSRSQSASLSNTSQKEPNVVNLRFERQALPTSLLQELQSITTFQSHQKTLSISFKFEELNEESRGTIQQIMDVLIKYT